MYVIVIASLDFQIFVGPADALPLALRDQK
jgi:hypothetical protein